jgi:hypothetical protein
MAETCQLSGGWYPLGTEDAFCGGPSIAVLTVACVHEHVSSARACAGCAAEVQRVDDRLICLACREGPGPHDCPLTLTIRWTVTA